MDAATIAISLLLVGLSVGMITSHLWVRQRERSNQIVGSRTEGLSKKQFRRRVQMSLMLGVAGIAMLVSLWLPKNPLLLGCYWLGITLWFVWIVLLAFIEIIATQKHFSLLQQDQRIEQVQLETKLRRTRRNDNGHSSKVP